MPTLTKTCSSCGLQKPLSAFLEMAGPQGTTYGNICATCRKANRDKASASKEREEDTTSETGFSIGNKEKAKSDSDKRKLRHDTEESYHEERDKKEEKTIITKDKVKETLKKQIEHRKSFLEKPTFLDNKTKQTAAQPGSPEDIAQREQRTDMSVPFIDTQIAGKRKRTENPFFNAWIDWVDKTSPIAQAAQRARDIKEGKNLPTGKSEKDAGKFAENTWEKERPKKRPR